MKPMTVYTANVSGQASNVHYPNMHTVTTAAELEAVARFDHVVAEYAGGKRSNAGFISSNCLVMDVDNDHTDTPEEWITPEKLAQMLPGVGFMTATSRNHMRLKGVQSARPRFHVYLPIHPVRDAGVYAGLKKQLSARFGFFDSNAVDASRFIYGHPTPQVTVHDGDTSVDAWLADAVDMFAAFDASTQAIGEGSRNATLSRFAGRVLIRYGNTDQARELFDRKASLCDPPLPSSEVEAIWDSALRFALKVAADPSYLPPQEYEALVESLRPDDFTDVGQATIFAAHYADRARFTTATKWLAYHEGAWRESEQKARRVAQELTSAQLDEARKNLARASETLEASGAEKVLEENTKPKAIAKFSDEQAQAYDEHEDALGFFAYAMKRRDTKRISACLKEAEPLLEVDPERLDAHPYLLNTPSATFDLRDGSRREHDPSDLLTKQTSLNPSTDGAHMWEETLNLIFQRDSELIGYVQRVCGLAAIGKVMIEALIIAYGDGANGKSTFWNTIARVLGNYADSISADVLIAGKKNNAKNDMAETRGKRLLIAAETEEGRRLSTSAAKQLASTDKIAAEKKYKDPFSFTPSHTLVLYTNHLPKVGARDAGIWRRLIVIPFEAKIEGSTDVKNYADHLYTHAGGAILAWVMEGARLIHAENYQLQVPAKVHAATEAYRAANDWFAHFLEECCQLDPGLSEKSGAVYDAYRSWALGRGEYVRSTTDFYAEIDKTGFNRRRTNSARMIDGLALISGFAL